MPKIPRDLSGRELAKFLAKYGYKVLRQTGSHMRLESNLKNTTHKITIPAHDSIKISTLNNILVDVADYLEISKQDLIEKMFKE
jgi:predicted RNA binding protein YcfA (HicA-like mRNA interferase family)